MTEHSTVRVLWLVKGLGPGGAERLLVEHARAADDKTISYEVAYLLEKKRHLVPDLTALGVPTHCLGVARELDPRWILRLWRLLHDGHYDVVHAHSPLVAAVARIVVRAMPRSGRPAFVYTEHNNWDAYSPVTRVANRLTYTMNDRVVAVSENARSSVSSRHRTQVEVVLHGIDLETTRAHLAERKHTRARLDVAPEQQLVVTVANFREGKGYPDLLQAAHLVVERNADVRFVAAGQGQLEQEIRALHQQLGLEDRFRLLGYVPDAASLIGAADVFALASHQEGLPVSMMEALALGVPVVAPAVGGLRHAVTTGENGVLCEPGSAVALAEALEHALVPEVLLRLRAGAQRSGAQFSSRCATTRLEEIYRAVAR